MLKNKLYQYGSEDLEVPVHLNFGQHILRKIWSYGDANALVNVDTGESLTYRDFAYQVVNVALSLSKLGVSRGDAVAICSEKCPEFLPTLLGIMCCGATFVPLDVTSGKASMLHRLNIAKPTIVFCCPNGWHIHKETLQSSSLHTFIIFGDQTESAITYKQFLTERGNVEDFEATPVNGWKDVAIILFSSGTTGLPKGVPLTHLNFLVYVNDKGLETAYRGQPVLSTREWYQAYGIGFALVSVLSGATVLYSLQNQVEDFVRAIEKYKVKIIQLAPTKILALLKSPLLPGTDVSSLERIISASTPADAAFVNSVKRKFPNLRDVYQLYGMSEVGCVCSEETATKGAKPGSVGQPSHGAIVKEFVSNIENAYKGKYIITEEVVNFDTREPLGPMERGEICVKSSAITPGYLNESLDIDLEGFLLTGDVGYYDEDGYFFIIARIKELIKFDSYHVAPAELESVLQQHQLVREVGVVGVPHKDYYEVPLAFVVVEKGATISEEELIAYVDTQVSHRMRLEGGLRFVDALPRGLGDKLDRKALKLML